jgi:hypothetical protein
MIPQELDSGWPRQLFEPGNENSYLLLATWVKPLIRLELTRLYPKELKSAMTEEVHLKLLEK